MRKRPNIKFVYGETDATKRHTLRREETPFYYEYGETNVMSTAKRDSYERFLLWREKVRPRETGLQQAIHLHRV